MALLFVSGVMNMLWMAVIAGLVLIEKVVPGGDWIGRATGVVLGGWGLGLIASVFL
jgi:predicted metal-binding membrane protein